MPAESKKQQRFFGLVKAIQEGKATGSGKAEEAAESMSRKSVKDYAATSHEDLPESKKESMDPNIAKLLRYAAISAGVGIGGAGLYGLAKYVHDQSLLGGRQGQKGRIKRRESLLATPQSRQLAELLKSESVGEDTSSNPAEMLSDAKDNQSDLPKALIEDMQNPDQAEPYKQSNIWESMKDTAKEVVGEPMLAGALTPIAAIAPAAATFIIGQRLVNQYRKAKIQKQIDKAKKEFEAALSKTSSELQLQIDELYKEAENKYEAIPAENILPASQPAAGVGIGPSGLAYTAGLAPGAGALLGWMLMHRYMKKDPEAQKLRELNALLKRDIASGALSSGIDLEEGKEEGKPTFKL